MAASASSPPPSQAGAAASSAMSEPSTCNSERRARALRKGDPLPRAARERAGPRAWRRSASCSSRSAGPRWLAERLQLLEELWGHELAQSLERFLAAQAHAAQLEHGGQETGMPLQAVDDLLLERPSRVLLLPRLEQGHPVGIG